MKSNKLWIVALKTMLMSAFCSIVTFMLICLLAAVFPNQWQKTEGFQIEYAVILLGLITQFIFLYGTLWDCGDVDQQKINLGIAHYSKFRGVLIGFIAAIPYYLMAIAMMLMSFKLIPDVTGIIRVCSSQFWGFYHFLHPVPTSSNPSLTAQWGQTIATPLQATIACFVPTIIPILSYFPYNMGRKRIIIGEKLVFADNKKK